MDDRFTLNDDQVETRRALLKLLEYVEEECARVGFSASTWMIAMSRNTLARELTTPSLLPFDRSGRPRLN